MEYVQEVFLPDSVKEIGERAFWGFSDLRHVSFGNGLKKIGKGAFEGCQFLKQALLPDSVEEIGAYAFEDDIRLEKIVIPSSLLRWDKTAIRNCPGLKEVENHSVLSCEMYRFDGCITWLVNGKGVKTIPARNNASAAGVKKPVHYDLNGGEACGILPRHFQFGTEMNLPDCVKKKGYEFICWCDDKLGFFIDSIEPGRKKASVSALWFQTYTVESRKKGEVMITVDTTGLSSGYEGVDIRYSASKDMSHARYLPEGIINKGSKKVENLKSGETYYFQVGGWGDSEWAEEADDSQNDQDWMGKRKVLPPSHTHAYGTDWKSDMTTHWKECPCGEKTENAAHTEDAGTVTKEATETETGIKTYKCVVCGYVTRTEEIEKHAEGFFEKGNETTTEVETPPEAVDIPEDDRILSITINPAFNMKHKDGSDVELDLAEIKIKAKEIYDEAGLKRAEAALGETLNGNKKYNLLDLTLLYNGKDFSNGYVGLVKVIIPLPKGHRDKTFSCYRLIDGKKELIPGKQTEDSYIIYLEHFSEYALVADGPEEPEEPHTHVYSTDWKSDATGHWKECACNDKAEESVHTQDAGTVTKEATKTEPGIKAYRCSVCGYLIKTEEIAILPADEEPINKKIPAATIVTKAQKKKNEIIINKKVSFKIIGNSLVVTWNKLSGADGYDIYVAFCGDEFKGITASVGKNKSSSVIRKLNGMKINGRKTYKVQIKAYRLLQDGKKQYIGTSAVMHVAGSQNKTTTNAKSISLKKKAYALKKGKSAKICATIIKADKKKELLSKKHKAELSYVSSDETIATVTATGKIKAKKRGKCIIYVRALNGISKKIKVNVN